MTVETILAELRAAIEAEYPTPSRAKSLALTKLDEFELWIKEAKRIS